MKNATVKKATRSEEAYVHDMACNSALEKLERGEVEALRIDEYPEPLRRFLKRSRATLHIHLHADARRRLTDMSRHKGIPADELARQLLEESLARKAV